MTDNDPPDNAKGQTPSEKLARAARRYDATINAVSDVFYAMDEDWRIVVFNPAAAEYFGFGAERVLNKSLWDVFPQGRGGRYEEMCRAAKDKGERSTRVMPSALRPGRSVQITFAPWDDGVCVAITDVTDRKTKEEQVHHLMAEVNHRSKNLLAVVQAVARQTAVKSPKDFVSSFEQRLMALAKAQDLLVQGEWRSVGLKDLIAAELEHFAVLVGQRIILDGPDIAVTPAAAQTLGMALHELATNAAKYGALSNDVGAVTISWGLERPDNAGEHLVITWREIGGPTVKEPLSKGFGSSVTGPMVRKGLEAEVEITFLPEGLTWRVSCEAERIVAQGLPPRVETSEASLQPRASILTSRARGRILIVEDEPLVGMEIAEALHGAGFTVLGPVTSNRDAMALLAEEGCDAAVLDVNLGRETSEPLARKLTSDGIPFVTLTGYAPDQVPAVFRRARLLTKPILTDVLVAELAGRLGAPSAG